MFDLLSNTTQEDLCNNVFGHGNITYLDGMQLCGYCGAEVEAENDQTDYVDELERAMESYPSLFNGEDNPNAMTI